MMEEEQEKLDNMPESLQESERGDAMQFAIDQLEEASIYLQCSIDAINEILEGWPMERKDKELAIRIMNFVMPYLPEHIREEAMDIIKNS